MIPILRNDLKGHWGIWCVPFALVLLLGANIPSSSSLEEEGDDCFHVLSPEKESPAQETLERLARVYPHVEGPWFEQGDWWIRVNDKVFAWDEARMRPQGRELKPNSVSYDFRTYSLFPRNPQEYTQDMIEKIQNREQRIDEGLDQRDSAFWDALYGIPDRETAGKRLVHVRFLGRRVLVNPLLVEPLAQVEQRILALETKEIRDWINGLGEVGGFAWRTVSGSGNRSLHSYGVAVDLLPRDFKGLQAYWRWTRASRDDWWATPLSGRHSPPRSVIQAFSEEGFVWGGSWVFFDQFHFEYRPEQVPQYSAE
ncbi:MAG: M15 family metallopeptidase [Spirochaetales bacterium]|nr:M15 family metallopeptidase [Spirochaetales bacterium]